MKRIVITALSVLAVSVTFSLTGCDSGGVETGVPTDTKQDPSIDKIKGNLAPITPPSVAKPKPKDATTPAEKK
jgi:hypothetical protein